jgi:hypothetical protein
MQPVCTAIAYFGAHELDCNGTRDIGKDGHPIPGTGVIKMDPRFARALPELREAWGEPLLTNSVCRTPAHNTRIGGHWRSLHLTDNPHWPSVGSMAADIRWRSWSTTKKLAFARMAYSMGWSVGLHDGFCHVDRRADIGLTKRCFLYGTWGGVFDPSEVTA